MQERCSLDARTPVWILRWVAPDCSRALYGPSDKRCGPRAPSRWGGIHETRQLAELTDKERGTKIRLDARFFAARRPNIGITSCIIEFAKTRGRLMRGWKLFSEPRDT